MRGDQLSRQWRGIRAIKASPNGLTVAKIANLPPELEALQDKCRTKAQRPLFPLSLLHLIEKQVKKNSLRISAPFREVPISENEMAKEVVDCPYKKTFRSGLLESVYESVRVKGNRVRIPEDLIFQPLLGEKVEVVTICDL